MNSLIRHIAQRDSSSRNMMVRIATAAVAVSIAVVVISLAVIFGFKEQITALVSGATADVTVSSPYAHRQPESHPITDNEELRKLITSTENIAHIEPYAVRNAIVRGEGGAEGISLRGVDSEADISLFASRLESGAMPEMEGARRKEILLSRDLARRIGAETGSRIEIVLIDEGSPRRELFKVCGIYRSVLGNVASSLAITDIRNVQKINRWDESQITGYVCRLDVPELALATAESINIRLIYDYQGEDNIAAVSAQELHGDIFGWLETHNVNATVILVIMLVVAIFNVVTALLILVLERTRMVGTLKSMGMTNKAIRRIFTHHAARITLRGLIIGNALALVLLVAQQMFHIVKLDESGYFLSEVPVALGAGWIVIVNILFAAIIVAVTHIATSIVGRIKVAEALKYE